MMWTQSAMPRARPILDRHGQILAILPEERRRQRQVRGACAHLGNRVDEQERALARHQIAEETDHPGIRRTPELLQEAGAGAGPVRCRAVGVERAVHHCILAGRREQTRFRRGELGDGDDPISRPRGEVA
jgi:hypothetical protein